MLANKLSVLIVVVTTFSVTTLTHGFRLTKTLPSRHHLPGSDDTHVSASTSKHPDPDPRVNRLSTVINYLDALRMLKDIEAEDFDRQEPMDYDTDVMFNPVPPVHLGRPVPLSGLDVVLSHGGEFDSLGTSKRSRPWFSKRRTFNCDLRKVTLNTIVEYIRSGKICGFKVSNVRFGLGRK